MATTTLRAHRQEMGNETVSDELLTVIAHRLSASGVLADAANDAVRGRLSTVVSVAISIYVEQKGER